MKKRKYDDPVLVGGLNRKEPGPRRQKYPLEFQSKTLRSYNFKGPELLYVIVQCSYTL